MTTPPPLIAIAEGRRPRTRKAPVYRPRESRLHTDVANLLRDYALPDWRWRHIGAKAKDAREGAIMKRLGVIAGWPDFLLVSPYGSVRFLELKRMGEEPSDAQDDFRLWCVQRGIPHVVAWTMDEVGAACDAWGCLRVKFTHAYAQPEALIADGGRP